MLIISIGTSKLINAIDESVDRIRSIMDEYSDVGGTDTSTREHVLYRFEDKFVSWSKSK